MAAQRARRPPIVDGNDSSAVAEEMAATTVSRALFPLLQRSPDRRRFARWYQQARRGKWASCNDATTRRPSTMLGS
jgi:hypothetical protein